MNISKYLFSVEYAEKFKKLYSEPEKSEHLKETTIKQKPFKAVALAKFIENETDLCLLRSEALQVATREISNDLYNLHQSCDISCLKEEDYPGLTSLRKVLLVDFLPKLRELLNIELEEGCIDLTASLYEKGDYLLCHDDHCGSRRVAFILYLTEEGWSAESDGGVLNLISHSPVDEAGLLSSQEVGSGDNYHPAQVVDQLVPLVNTLSFFEVGPYSFHEVAEVMSNKRRLSINGWFHGPSMDRKARNFDALLQIPRISAVEIEENLVYRWINHTYLDMEQQEKIKSTFIEHSEAQLMNFIAEDKWLELNRSLYSTENRHWWARIGPLDFRNYSVNAFPFTRGLDCSSLPEIWRQAYRLFSSEAMLLILSDCTGLCLMKLDGDAQRSEPEAKKPCSIELPNESVAMPSMRRFEPGDYTLVNDHLEETRSWRLEAIMHLAGYGSNALDEAVDCSGKWTARNGGQTVYFSRFDKEELLSVVPIDNALSLAYVEKDTAGFVRYVRKSEAKFFDSNNLASSAIDAFYDLFVSYDEVGDADNSAASSACSSPSSAGNTKSP